MADNQQIDHYDFINAPQFVDFDDLASHDDPQADRFFETHREEDDFMIPLDINNISPTFQLLCHTENDVEDDADDNEHYSNEANKAAIAAGLEDVKIEYYASPQNQATKPLSQPSSAKKSFNSVYGTPLGLGASGYSSGATSFHTPTGGEDKENVTPTASSAKKLKNELLTKTGKLDVIEDNDNGCSNSQRGVLSERSTDSDGHSPLRSYTCSPSVKTSALGSLPESLTAKLDNLAIVSSDEEEDAFAEYCMPKLQQEPTVSHSPVEVEATEQCMNYITFNDSKLSFLGLSVSNENSDQQEQGSSNNDSYSDHGDVTLVCPPVMETIEGKDVPISPIHSHNSSDSEEEDVDDDESAPIELRTPIRNILRRLDAELHMDLEHADSERENEPRCSILVAPSVGRQVHWNQESESLQHEIQMTNSKVEPRELNVSYKVGDLSMNLNEFTLTSDHNEDESDDEFFGVIMASTTSSSLVPPRRSSSVGDLVRALEPKTRDFTTYGYNPRIGITIPKTPDCFESHGVVTQEQQPGPSGMDAFSSNKNSCYFEIEPPKPSESMRRVSSCSDLLKHHEMKRKPVARRKPVQKKLPTIPRTPEALKRSQKLANRCNISSVSASSSCYEYANHNRKQEVAGKGPSVADRLAAARSRQPMKGNHYVSMAEAMIKYQKNTPDRFRSLPKGRMVPEKRSASCDSRKRYSPSPAHSPESNHRSRGDSFSSKTTKAGSNGPVLPKKVNLKPTIPKPFNFGATHRPKPVVVNEDTVDFKFKARPAPSKTHNENPTARARQPVKVTLPMSPRFASDERLRERHQKRAHNTTVTKSPESKQTRGRLQQKTSRIPITASSSRGHAEDHNRTTTIAQPFSSTFEARQKDILRKKEEKIKQELERANKIPEFHANPVPKFQGKLPKKKPIETTHVEPFRLKSDIRGAAYQEAFKLKLEGEEQQQKDLAVFYAQPADVIHKAPFEPERPTRLIEPQEFNLATGRRAAERELFDEQLREKEREDEEKKREEQEIQDEIQKLEDIERRRQMVHKAQPFKHPKAFQLKPSGKALTVPQSPAFSALPSERRVIKPQSPSTQ